MPAKCKVCEAKSETIEALQTAVLALTELVNLQRAIPAAEAATVQPKPGMSLVPPAEPEPDDIVAQLNAGVQDPELAERLATQLQAFVRTE